MSSKPVLLSLLVLVLSAGLTTLQAADEEPAASGSSAGYVSVGEKMILNLATDSRRLTFLQLEADVLVKDEDAREVVETHIPVIRHQLIIHLSEQSVVDMKTPARREELRQLVTQQVREMLDQMAADNNVEEVLFTTFLVQ